MIDATVMMASWNGIIEKDCGVLGSRRATARVNKSD
jgi:hypothetical protein